MCIMKCAKAALLHFTVFVILSTLDTIRTLYRRGSLRKLVKPLL